MRGTLIACAAAAWCSLAAASMRPASASDPIPFDGRVGDGIADATEAIQRVIDGGGTVVVPKGTYRLTRPLVLKTGVRLRFEAGAILMQDAANPVLTATGSKSVAVSLDRDAFQGSATVALPAERAREFAVGDWVGLQADVVVAAPDGKPREIHRVTRVEGDVLTLDCPLSWTYPVEGAAKFFEWFPVTDLEIDGGEVRNDAPTTKRGYAILVQDAAFVRVKGIKLTNAGGGIGFADTQDVVVDGVFIDRLPNFEDAFGYGVWVFGASRNVLVTNLIGRDTRHVFTTLAAGDEIYGIPQDIVVSNCIGVGGPDSLSIFDTHEYGYRITFDNCHALGPGRGSGFQIRGQSVRIVDSSAFHAAHRGVICASSARDVQIRGGEFARNSLNGIACSAVNATIDGAYVHDNAGAGIVTGPSSPNSVVRSTRLEENDWGIEDQGALHPVYQGNLIVGSPKQKFGILTPSATSVVKDNVFRGFYDATKGIHAPVAGGTILDNVGLPK